MEDWLLSPGRKASARTTTLLSGPVVFSEREGLSRQRRRPGVASACCGSSYSQSPTGRARRRRLTGSVNAQGDRLAPGGPLGPGFRWCRWTLIGKARRSYRPTASATWTRCWRPACRPITSTSVPATRAALVRPANMRGLPPSTRPWCWSTASAAHRAAVITFLGNGNSDGRAGGGYFGHPGYCPQAAGGIAGRVFLAVRVRCHCRGSEFRTARRSG